MTQLTFTNDNGYISNIFPGDVVLQIAYKENAIYTVNLESRLDSTLPWTVICCPMVKKLHIMRIPASAKGQEYRLTCSVEPEKVVISPLAESTSSSQEGDHVPPNSVNSQSIENDSVQEEDLTPEVRAKLNAMNDSEDVTEEEIEDCIMDALRANGLEEQITQEAGAAEGEVSGDGPELD